MLENRGIEGLTGNEFLRFLKDQRAERPQARRNEEGLKGPRLVIGKDGNSAVVTFSARVGSDGKPICPSCNRNRKLSKGTSKPKNDTGRESLRCGMCCNSFYRKRADLVNNVGRTIKLYAKIIARGGPVVQRVPIYTCPKCERYKDVTTCGRVGVGGKRRYKCKSCQSTFTEQKGGAINPFDPAVRDMIMKSATKLKFKNCNEVKEYVGKGGKINWYEGGDINWYGEINENEAGDENEEINGNE
jgi:transposase-like protein